MEYKRIADKKRLSFVLAHIRSNVPKNGRILDVGCGNGIITVNVGAIGYQIKGIDVSEKSIQKASAQKNVDNVTFEVKSAEQLLADGIKYDAVICSEVIEHLQNPDTLLKTLFEALTDNGILIVTVPNGNGPRELFVTKPVQYLQKQNGILWQAIKQFKKILGYKGTTIQSDAEDLTHIQFFTVKSLADTANRNGFYIVSLGKSNFIDDVFPFSILCNRIPFLQKIDSKIADLLPPSFTGGFLTVWKKK